MDRNTRSSERRDDSGVSAIITKSGVGIKVSLLPSDHGGRTVRLTYGDELEESTDQHATTMGSGRRYENRRPVLRVGPGRLQAPDESYPVREQNQSFNVIHPACK